MGMEVVHWRAFFRGRDVSEAFASGVVAAGLQRTSSAACRRGALRCRCTRQRVRPRRIPNKVLRIAFPTAETGFDPARVSDLYSDTINEAIFERLLTYDYLARPAKLVPMAAEAMPRSPTNGSIYTFQLRKGIYFTPDPAFKGAKRELVAQDFVYSFMRFVDPKNPFAVRRS